MNKKAFTLVQLAIVLIVIGIIATMAIKGRELIYVARMKKEIRTMLKMDEAMQIYIATYGGQPTLMAANTSCDIDMTVFNDILPENERRMVFTTALWHYTRAKLVPDPVGTISDWSKTVGEVFCYADSPIITAQTAYPYTRADVMCYIEKQLDDGRLDFGNGRVQQGGGVDTVMDLNRCDANKATFKIYNWRVN